MFFLILSTSFCFGKTIMQIDQHDQAHRSSEGLDKINNQNATNSKDNCSTDLKEAIVLKTERIEKYESKIFDGLSERFERYYVPINNQKYRIWTLSMNHQLVSTPVVFIHGACCSIGLWALNIEEISKTNPVYAIDILGFGRSSRPKFGNDPAVIENQFVDSVEDWRREVGLTQMILVGHSFGGFLSTSYALKYPQHVKSLVLVDPWGFAEPKPYNQIPSMLRMYAGCGQYFTPASFFRKFGRMGLLLYKMLYSPTLKYKFRPLLGEHNTIYKYVYHSNRYKPR